MWRTNYTDAYDNPVTGTRHINTNALNAIINAKLTGNLLVCFDLVLFISQY